MRQRRTQWMFLQDPVLKRKGLVCANLKELRNLELKVASVDILALNEKKMTAQVDLIPAQSEVIVAKCMFEKTNRYVLRSFWSFDFITQFKLLHSLLQFLDHSKSSHLSGGRLH